MIRSRRGIRLRRHAPYAPNHSAEGRSIADGVRLAVQGLTTLEQLDLYAARLKANYGTNASSGTVAKWEAIIEARRREL